MRILSFNICGLNSAYKKGFGKWLKDEKPDLLALQEIRTSKLELPLNLFSHYKVYINPSSRKGFWGVAVITKFKPLRVFKRIGHSRFDLEGRFLRLDFPNFSFINIHIPHGKRDKSEMGYKLEILDKLLDYLTNLKNVILAGDFNIAHTPKDLARPKENINNTMFTEAEREKIENLISLGFIDTFREFNKDKGNYTWWLRGFNARRRNIGWRIDYIFVSKKLRGKLRNAFILTNINLSDHCPVGIGIDL